MGEEKLDTTTEVVMVPRPPRVPGWLRRATGAKSYSAAREALADVIGRHSTYLEAAEELGVDEKTLRHWRRRYRIEAA